jgi:hypothetical protein
MYRQKMLEDQMTMAQNLESDNVSVIFWYVKSFCSQQKSLHIGVRSDSTTAVAYVNDMGGMSSVLLDKLSAEIWSWCSQRNIFITASSFHLPPVRFSLNFEPQPSNEASVSIQQSIELGLINLPFTDFRLTTHHVLFFRKIGITCNYYIDGSLNMNQNFDICAQNTETMVQKLDDLGFRINFKKSVLIPCRHEASVSIQQSI